MLTTPLSQLTGGWHPVERLCVEVLVYVGFLDLINAPPFRLLKQSTLLSGMPQRLELQIGILNL